MSHCLIKTVPTGKGRSLRDAQKNGRSCLSRPNCSLASHTGGVLVRGAEVCIFQEVNVAASVRALRGESALMTVIQSNSVVPSR